MPHIEGLKCYCHHKVPRDLVCTSPHNIPTPSTITLSRTRTLALTIITLNIIITNQHQQSQLLQARPASFTFRGCR